MAEEAPEAIAIIDGDGNFVENFWENLDDDMKESNYDFKQFVGQNVKDALRMTMNAERKMGMNKIPLPGENADDSEWNEVFKAIGKPETAGDYPYERPENIPEEARNDEVVKAMRERAHNLNWTKKQWDTWIKQEDERLLDDIKTRETNDRADLEAGEKRLKELWGMAYDERIAIVNRLLNETIPDEAGGEKGFSFNRSDFIAQHGRDPMIVEWLAGLGKDMVEHEALIAELSQQAPKEAQAELDDLQASDDYKAMISGTLYKTNPSKAKALEQREMELYRIINPPEKKTA